MDTYFNTTHVKGQELKDYKEKAKTQNKMILAIFKANIDLTAAETLLAIPADKRPPFSSVVRAINTLTRCDLIEKTDIKRMGSYGRKVGVWKYSNSAETL